MAHKVTAYAGVANIQLPNGAVINGSGVVLPDGKTVVATSGSAVLTDEQFAFLPGSLFTNNILIDNGEIGGSGDAVTTQAADVANVGALTSSQNATATAVDLPTSEALANALKTNYNQLQTDVAAIRTTLNSLLTNLRTTGGAML